MEAFTILIQQQVDDYWRERVRTADRDRLSILPGKEIRTYLNDKSTLNTISFVIRRYLQKHCEALLNDIAHNANIPYADLINGTPACSDKGLNADWPDELLKPLSKKLSGLSKEKGIVLSASTWKRYLMNSTTRLNGDSVFRIAFTLRMDVETTLELMMASGQNPYCMRDPEHFIYYYCQKRKSAFDWNHALGLINEYKKRIDHISYTAMDSSKGMTMILQNYVTQLINSNASEDENDRLLIDYMVKNRKEFTNVNLSTRDDFIRFANYLKCFYPDIDEKGKKSQSKKSVKKSQTEVQTSEKEPELNVGALVQAMFSEGGWFNTTEVKKKGVRTSSSLLRRLNKDNLSTAERKKQQETESPFLHSVQFFVDHYAQHLTAIERVYRNPDHAQNVERRDIILFTYFFVIQYLEKLDYNDTTSKLILDKVECMLSDDGPMDRCMDDLICEINDLYDEDANTKEYHWEYINLFNLVLTHFGMHPMYMPCPFDRFIYMSLFSEDPSAITSAVLWNDGGDESLLEDGAVYATTQCKSNLDKPALLVNPKTGERVKITTSMFTIGRKKGTSPSNDSTQDDAPDYGLSTDILAISHIHSVIFYEDNRFYLADVSKIMQGTDANRTRLNDVKLQPNGEFQNIASLSQLKYFANLKSGDIIKICSESLTFIFE